MGFQQPLCAGSREGAVASRWKGHYAHWLLISLIVTLLAAFQVTPSWADGRSYPPLFGTTEKMFPGSGAFPRWNDMLQRLARNEQINVVPCRREQGINICEVDKWKAFVTKERGHSIMDELDDVNRYMNAYPYVIDMTNYGVEDYWATPHEHISNGGDCEDYAIAKYMTLKQLGVSVDDMRIVVLNDLNLRVQHAVLAVYVGSRAYILDNQTSRVLAADVIRHYQPIYSLTEGTWWMHILATTARR